MTPTYTGTLVGSDGSRLVVRDAELVPATPTPAPTPTPTPTPTPAGDRRRIVWHYGWGAPSLDAWPVDVRAGVSHVTLAMCQSAAAGTGRLTDPPAVTKGQVVDLTSSGVGVTVGIGGAGDGGITCSSDATASQLVQSVLSIRDRLGITGITWDLEGTPGAAWTTAAVLVASRALFAAGMTVGIWSALYGGRLAAWGAVAQGLGESLAWWERGFYDFPQANDARLTGIVTDDLTSMRRYVARDDQLVASFAPVGQTSKTPVPVTTAAYAAARKARPAVGWSVWTDRYDAPASWSTTRALAALA